MDPYVYVASSWRNTYQPLVVSAFHIAGIRVYDFRNPNKGDHGFHWSEIDSNWKEWSTPQFAKALKHPVAISGFKKDSIALADCTHLVLVLPCGRSAHLEAGAVAGLGKPTIMFSPRPCEPELMYGLMDQVTDNLREVVDFVHRERF